MATDPFEGLRLPLVPLAPRPSFTNELRRRLAAQLGTTAPTSKENPVPEIREYTPARLHSLTPYLCCKGADRAIEWYRDVFDAVLMGDPIVMDEGHVGHAELRVGDTVFMLADEYEVENVRSPLSLGGQSVGFMLHVPDADTTYGRALAAGATAVRPLGESYGARTGVLLDPFGHRWFISTQVDVEDLPVEDVPGRRFGDVGYLTIGVADGERARRFYEGLFDWRFEQGHQPGSFHITSITPPAGVDGRAGDPEVRVYFRVDDLDAATARVAALGGQVLSVAQYESGGNAECRDDQGLRFDLFRPRPGY